MELIPKTLRTSIGEKLKDDGGWRLTLEEAKKARIFPRGMTYEQLWKLEPKFRHYLRVKDDVGCGLAKWFLTARQYDRYFRACAVHDFWFDNREAAIAAGITIEDIDGWFVEQMDTIRAELMHDFPKWAWFYKHQGSLYKFLVTKISKRRWKKHLSGEKEQ